MMFLVGVAHCSLCATIGAVAVTIYLREMIQVKPIAAEANPPNQLKKLVSTERRLIAFSKLNPHRISNTNQAGRTNEKRVCCKAKLAAARIRQDADASPILLLCLGSLY
jgi:hypothetical protein